ncbi:MAG: RHS repeat-associated core domain-containing protein [Nitrospira sp.]|jgi:RHS repeat-associated protein|nr:RHS repeat-associated core domain-containing protein [Nitrospira sp.]
MPTDSTATGFAVSFSYDAFGRRTGKTVQGVTTNFLYDGLNPVQEKNGATVTANLLTGLNIDEFFTRTDGVGVRALLPDALGSTVALGDNTGTLQTQYTYEPFGFASQTGLASTNSYKYTGREEDCTGLLYYRARYYHPRLQRFIAEDPIGSLGGDPNLYGYVRNRTVDEFGTRNGDRLLFWLGFPWAAARAQRGFQSESGRNAVLPLGGPKRLLPIHTGAEGGEVDVEQRGVEPVPPLR